MWVKRGCRGLFFCNAVLVECGKRHKASTTCNCTGEAPLNSLTTINRLAVKPRAVQVLRLDTIGLPTLRYFTVVEDETTASDSAPGGVDNVLLVARIDLPKRSTMPRTTQLDFATIVLSMRPRPGAGFGLQTILHDYSLSHNLVLRKHGQELYAVGGQATFPKHRELKFDPRVRNDLRDGVRLLRADNVASLRAGRWSSTNHSGLPLLTSGRHPGCVSQLRSGVPLPRCEYDGKLGLVRHRERWLLYARANTKPWGGRFLQVASSAADDVAGPYGPFRRLSIRGYDARSDANIYFAAVNVNPVRIGSRSTLLGLFPINLGEVGTPNGNGEAFVALSLSCDGVHWSELTPLVWCLGVDGRTLDHPVDGIVAHEGVGVHFWLARDAFGVLGRHRRWRNETSDTPRLVRYELRWDVLEALTARALGTSGGLEGCAATVPP